MMLSLSLERVFAGLLIALLAQRAFSVGETLSAFYSLETPEGHMERFTSDSLVSCPRRLSCDQAGLDDCFYASLDTRELEYRVYSFSCLPWPPSPADGTLAFRFRRRLDPGNFSFTAVGIHVHYVEHPVTESLRAGDRAYVPFVQHPYQFGIDVLEYSNESTWILSDTYGPWPGSLGFGHRFVGRIARMISFEEERFLSVQFDSLGHTRSSTMIAAVAGPSIVVDMKLNEWRFLGLGTSFIVDGRVNGTNEDEKLFGVSFQTSDCGSKMDQTVCFYAWDELSQDQDQDCPALNLTKCVTLGIEVGSRSVVAKFLPSSDSLLVCGLLQSDSEPEGYTFGLWRARPGLAVELVHTMSHLPVPRFCTEVRATTTSEIAGFGDSNQVLTVTNGGYSVELIRWEPWEGLKSRLDSIDPDERARALEEWIISYDMWYGPNDETSWPLLSDAYLEVEEHPAGMFSDYGSTKVTTRALAYDGVGGMAFTEHRDSCSVRFCRPGSYQSGPGCNMCPIGTISELWRPSSSSECPSCPLGTMYISPTSCSSCLPMKTSLGGNSPCLSCNETTFTMGEAPYPFCFPCGPGHFYDTTVNPFVSTIEELCPKCFPGSYSPEVDCPPHFSELACNAHPPGLSTCLLCPPGMHSRKIEGGRTVSEACEFCSEGTFAATPGLADCIACPSNEVCLRGASSSVPANAFYDQTRYTDHVSASAQEDVNLWLRVGIGILVGSGVMLLISVKLGLVLVIHHCDVVERMPEIRCITPFIKRLGSPTLFDCH